MNRSTNTVQPGQLFGRSLDSVVDQESSGFLVPLLVKRCVTEIEKRGLDIIGLYRLCGSETKKKMLREAFEAEPEAVDLSSENVPDINVITSKTWHILILALHPLPLLYSSRGQLNSIDQLLRLTEGVPEGAPRAGLLKLSLPDAGGCCGSLSS